MKTIRALRVNRFYIEEKEWDGVTYVTIDGRRCQSGISYFDAIKVCGQPRYSILRKVRESAKGESV